MGHLCPCQAWDQAEAGAPQSPHHVSPWENKGLQVWDETYCGTSVMPHITVGFCAECLWIFLVVDNNM